MRNKKIEKSLNWDAHYVGIKAMKERQQNCITLEELVLEGYRQLSVFVPFTIEEQVPVFTAWGGKPGKNTTTSQKKSCWRKRKSL
jgi:hypothetical protein